MEKGRMHGSITWAAQSVPQPDEAYDPPAQSPQISISVGSETVSLLP